MRRQRQKRRQWELTKTSIKRLLREQYIFFLAASNTYTRIRCNKQASLSSFRRKGWLYCWFLANKVGQWWGNGQTELEEEEQQQQQQQEQQDDEAVAEVILDGAEVGGEEARTTDRRMEEGPLSEVVLNSSNKKGIASAQNSKTKNYDRKVKFSNDLKGSRLPNMPSEFSFERWVKLFTMWCGHPNITSRD